MPVVVVLTRDSALFSRELLRARLAMQLDPWSACRQINSIDCKALDVAR